MPVDPPADGRIVADHDLRSRRGRVGRGELACEGFAQAGGLLRAELDPDRGERSQADLLALVEHRRHREHANLPAGDRAAKEAARECPAERLGGQDAGRGWSDSRRLDAGWLWGGRADGLRRDVAVGRDPPAIVVGQVIAGQQPLADGERLGRLADP